MEQENLKFYNQLKAPPADALKTIKAGRMQGKSDISPQWRVEILTEVFGPCGIGWYFEITRQWTENNEETKETMCFTNILLYVKADGEWSKGIPGTGGSMLVTKERNGLYTSDEGYKMALTDAISVASKMLGVAADVYRGKLESKGVQGETTKYNKQQKEEVNQEFVSGLIKAVTKVEGLTYLKNKYPQFVNTEWFKNESMKKYNELKGE